jgi:hypothetical protein
LSHGPHEGTQFASDGDPDLMRVLPPGAQLSIPCAEPHWGLPTDSLEAFGYLFQPELEMATHLSRVAIGPGAFAQGTSGLGLARLGAPSLTPALAPGGF